MSDKVVVKFVRQWSMYNGNETAGFTPARAAELVKSKIAVYVDPKKAAKALKAAKAKEPDPEPPKQPNEPPAPGPTPED